MRLVNLPWEARNLLYEVRTDGEVPYDLAVPTSTPAFDSIASAA